MKLCHFFLLFLLLPFLNKCKDGPCHEVPSVGETSFLVIDSLTGANLLQENNENNQSFDVDSIIVYNEDNSRSDIFVFGYSASSGGYRGYFNPAKRTGVEDPFLPDSAVFFIHWNPLDSDTLSAVYDFEPGEKCGWKINRYDLYFNGRLLNINQNKASYIFLK